MKLNILHQQTCLDACRILCQSRFSVYGYKPNQPIFRSFAGCPTTREKNTSGGATLRNQSFNLVQWPPFGDEYFAIEHHHITWINHLQMGHGFSYVELPFSYLHLFQVSVKKSLATVWKSKNHTFFTETAMVWWCLMWIASHAITQMWRLWKTTQIGPIGDGWQSPGRNMGYKKTLPIQYPYIWLVWFNMV